MNKIIASILIASAAFSACTKSSDPVVTPTPTPAPVSKSYMKITYSGKTLEARDTIVTYAGVSNLYPMLCKFNTTANPFNSSLLDKTIELNTLSGDKYFIGKFKLVLSTMNYASNNNNYVDTYYGLSTSEKAFFFEDLVAKQSYPINRNSSVTITHNDDQYTEGTMSLSLVKTDGSLLPATGEFKIYHK
jgi:hypothetical protein